MDCVSKSLRGPAGMAAILAGVVLLGVGETTPIRLSENGKCLVAIVRGSGDEFAARRLADEFRKSAEHVSVIEPGPAMRISEPVALYIGTLQSNPALANVVTALGWGSDVEKLPVEGYLIRTGVLKGKNVIVLAGGDRTGAIYAASDLKNYYLNRSAGDLAINAMNYTELPKMPYRWFWNWDARTNWELNDYYEHEVVPSYSARPFRKPPGAFLRNMKLCVDYMSEHKLNGLIIWGFLRDNHGGVQAAQELCRYANERGVKIIPGVNIDRNYGGFYHEGDHEFNMETRSQRYPRLRSMDKNGKYLPRTLCAEKAENRDWLRRGIRWLFDTFPIGGINVEFAEGHVCYTPDCVKERKGQPGTDREYFKGQPVDPGFFKDLARILPFVANEAHQRVPSSWISYATYVSFNPEMQANPPAHIGTSPDYSIGQWEMAEMLTELVPWSSAWAGVGWPEGVRPPGKEFTGLLGWNANGARDPQGFFAHQYREALRKSYRHGFKGITTFGERSAELPENELSYLAFSEFSYNPEMTDEDFLRRRVAPLYGGEEAGRLALEIARRIKPIRESDSPNNLEGILDLAYRGRRISAEPGKARWDKIIHYVLNSP
jgi:hypothetical protein